MLRFSIVCPTSGPLERVTPLLSSLKEALDSDSLLEVLIVINGKEAKNAISSGRFAEQAGPKVRVVAENVGSLLAGRHRGYSESRGDVISFLDDDVVVSPTWFPGLLAAFSSVDDLALAGGPSIASFASKPPKWLDGFTRRLPGGGSFNTLMSLIDLGRAPIVPVDPGFIWGLNMTVKKTALKRAGGFNPDLLPIADQMFQGDGEAGFANRFRSKNFLAGYFPEVGVVHSIAKDRMTLDFVRRRGYYDGVSSGFSSLRPWESSPVTVGTLSRARTLVGKGLSMLPDWIRHSSVRLAHRAAYYEGREFLLSEFTTKESVRKWVNKRDYWDYDHNSFR